MAIKAETASRLKKFINSEKYSQLQPETQERLTAALSQIETIPQMLGRNLKEATLETISPIVRGAYFGVPKKLRQAGIQLTATPFIDLARTIKGEKDIKPFSSSRIAEERLTEAISRLPESKRLETKLLEAGTGFLPFSQLVRPFSAISRTAPLIKKAPAIVKSMATGAGYGGARAIAEEEPAERIIPEALSTAWQFGAFHLGGKLGATAFPRRDTRFGSMLGGAGAGAITSPEDMVTGAVFGGGLGAKYPAEPFKAKPADVMNLYQTAIKPSIAGKKTRAATESYNKKANEAINIIAGNKEALENNKLPENVEEFGKAIETNLDLLYKEYKNKEIEAGASIPINKTVVFNKLKNNYIDNEVILPETRKVALSLFEYLKQIPNDIGSISEAIKQLNRPLKTNFRQMEFEGKAAPYVEAIKELRSLVDNAITSKVGKGWQESRNKYSALKTIEGDVNSMVNKLAKETNPKLYGSLMSTIGDSNIVAGIISANPMYLAKGLTIKGITAFIARQRDPNLKIKKMFKILEEQSQGKAIEPEVMNPFGRTIETSEQPAIETSFKEQRLIPFQRFALPEPSTKYGEGFQMTKEPTYNPTLSEEGKAMLRQLWERFKEQ